METLFTIGLLIATVATGLIWLIDIVWLRRHRKGTPIMLEWSQSLFPVFIIVFLLRSFIVEPFRIPSPSMLPTLQIGDLIMVNKFTYGMKFPVWNIPLTEGTPPKRGDVAVMHYPVNPEAYYIKRIIGVPGDKINYVKKQLFINDKAVSKRFIRKTLQPEDSASQLVSEYVEKMAEAEHDILVMPWREDIDFYNVIVPEGHYFVMGDNRDNSQDSRYWGFVPKENLVGRAFLIFFSIDTSKWDIRWSRLGKFVQ